LFFVPGPLAAVPPLGPCGEDADRLSESITIATPFGHLLDFPEHPHEGNAEADDDAQKQ